ncbi:phospholipase A1 member A isoform X2 [Emydura macquarii macquarii]|uniref:phospholipase A1 member A isoform X2 n=1 Tax=Emydura macquarii macquarii TaxID=1129001 RepID=UPI00352A0A4C
MGGLNRKMVEDPRKKPLFVLAIVLLHSSAYAGHETYVPEQPCSDFHTASLLRGLTLNVRFLLFTSSNPSCGQLISVGDDIKNSTFNTSLETKIIIHGFRTLGTKPSWINGLIDALLQAAKVNVVAVDWIRGATGDYRRVVENVMKLGLEIFHFINHLLALGVSETSIHLIGVSLGAHVGGLVGQFYEGRLGRITGLDPVGPKYTKASHEERLDPGDALFVEAIHTDTDSFGIRVPVGHIDYFINGGKDQPGCPWLPLSYNDLICDHMRAVHLYVSALKNSCPMMAFPCSNHEDFLAGHCLDCFNPFLRSCPRIVYHSLVEFHLQQNRSLVTNVQITFRSSNATATVKIAIPKQQQLGKGILAHPFPLCQIKEVMLTYVPKRYILKKEETLITGNFCTTPLPVSNRENMFCLSKLSLTRNKPFAHNLTVTCA